MRRGNIAMVVPERLKFGDPIALLAPSSPVTEKQAQECRLLLEQMGFRVWMGKSCTARLHGYLAGEALLRAEELNRAFADEEIRGIFCIRGGYGATQLLDLLDYEEIRKHPKVFLGYSDITCIHLALQRYCGFVTYHGPMPETNMLTRFDTYTREAFFSLLIEENKVKENAFSSRTISFQNPQGYPFHVISGGRGEGILCGGNLALFTSLVGTPYLPEPKGRVLFFEDIYESVPRVSRMLDQLEHSGILQQAEGILFGDFAECENTEEPSFGLFELLKERFCNYQKPVISGIKCGHCFPTGTLPLGIHCIVNAEILSIQFCEI